MILECIIINMDENRIETSLDWSDVRQKLTKLLNVNVDNQQLKQLLLVIDQTVTKLSIEEIECRRKKKQTKKHQELLNEINEKIHTFEQYSVYGALLNKG